MKHIAIVTTGLVGITNASLKMVSKLKSEGFKVTYLCPVDIKAKIVKHEIEYIQLPEINFDFSLSNSNGFLHHLKNLKSRYKESFKQMNFEVYEKVLNKLKPDLILIDVELHEVILSSIKLNIPVKLISQWFSCRMSYNLPPTHTTIIPKKGLNGITLAILYSWFFLKLKIFVRSILNTIKFKINRKSVLIKYAKNIGLSRKSFISRNFPSVLIYRYLPILSMTLQELEFPHSKPKNLTYIGPMILNIKPKTLIIPDTLKTIIESKINHDKKLIYCSITTMSETGDINFVKKVMDAVQFEKDWELIISLGGKLSTNVFEKLPNNVHVFKWVPQLYLLSKIDCSINHGGIHTINECISAKVPMLIYSGKKYDQNGCAARIKYHGLGLMGDKDIDSSKDIHSKIKNILSVNTYQKKINELNHIYKNYESKNIFSYL